MRSRRGSVLMEFVIVAPIYVFLLGGLFMVGDLVLNRIRMHIGDHFVTWVGGSRFCPVDDNGERSAEIVGKRLRPIFADAIGGAIVEYQVDVTVPGKDDSRRLNSFMALYFGGIVDIPVKVPDWVRGMMSLLNDGVDEYGRSVSYDANYPRSFVFHRLPLAGIDENSSGGAGDGFCRSRESLSASTVAYGGYVDNVARADPWITIDDKDRVQPVAVNPNAGSPAGEGKGRCLGMFGE